MLLSNAAAICDKQYVYFFTDVKLDGIKVQLFNSMLFKLLTIVNIVIFHLFKADVFLCR